MPILQNHVSKLCLCVCVCVYLMERIINNEFYFQYIISSSRDMLAGWHTNCLSCDVPPTPWLSEAERRYIDLIKCLDLLEVSLLKV